MYWIYKIHPGEQMMRSFIVVFLCLAPKLSAMENIQEAPEHSITSQFQALKKKIIVQIDLYSFSLGKSLGCDCCQFFNEALNTEEYQHVEQRQEELKIIKEMLNEPMFMPDDILSFIKKMEPFSGAFGVNFCDSCKKAIEKFLKKNPQDILENQTLCVVCNENRAKFTIKNVVIVLIANPVLMTVKGVFQSHPGWKEKQIQKID